MSIYSESSSSAWKALAGGWSILVRAANRSVAAAIVFLGRGLDINGGAFTAPEVPRPDLPSLLIRGTWNNRYLKHEDFNVNAM